MPKLSQRGLALISLVLLSAILWTAGYYAVVELETRLAQEDWV